MSNNVTPMGPYRDSGLPQEPQEMKLPEEPMEPIRKNPKWKILLLAVLMVLFILLICLFLFRDHLSVNVLRTLFSSGETGLYQYDDTGNNVYASSHNALAAVTGSGLTLFDASGSEVSTVQHVYTTPLLLTGDRLVLCCDVGGNRLSAVNQSGTAVLDLSTEGTILDADVSSGDISCYAELLKGYKTVLTVFDAKQNQIYRWYSSSKYLNQCAVSGDTLCASAVTGSGASFESTALLLKTTKEEPVAEVSLGNQLIWDLRFVADNTVCAVGEDSVVCLNTDGTVLGTYDYGTAYVTDYTISPDGFTALSVNEFQSGNRYSVVTIDEKGQKLAEQYLGEEILSLTTAGNKCAVLTTEHLYVYDKQLNLLSSTDALNSASSAVMQEDGSVILLGGGTGTLYLSN